MVLNLPSYSAGCNPWGSEQPSLFSLWNSDTGAKSSGKYAPQKVSDGLCEVVGIESIQQLAFLQMGGKGVRIAQGRHIEMVVKEELPCQIDGEPAILPPCSVSVTHGGHMRLLSGQNPSALLALPTALLVRRVLTHVVRNGADSVNCVAATNRRVEMLVRGAAVIVKTHEIKPFSTNSIKLSSEDRLSAVKRKAQEAAAARRMELESQMLVP